MRSSNPGFIWVTSPGLGTDSLFDETERPEIRVGSRIGLPTYQQGNVILLLFSSVPAGSPSRGGDVTVYVFDINQPSLPTPFLFLSWVYFCVYGPFNCISSHKFYRQLSAFSLCSSGLPSALSVLSTIYLSVKVSLSPDIILCG